jgi:hypothetical protein
VARSSTVMVPSLQDNRLKESEQKVTSFQLCRQQIVQDRGLTMGLGVNDTTYEEHLIAPVGMQNPLMILLL